MSIFLPCTRAPTPESNSNRTHQHDSDSKDSNSNMEALIHDEQPQPEGWADLPTDLLAAVLQRLHVADHLRCAAACTPWQHPALNCLKTNTLHIEGPCLNTGHLQQWLLQQPGLQHLNLSNCTGLSQLPYPKLHSLTLEGCGLDALADNQPTKHLASATQLTSLSLVDTLCTNDKQVSALRKLQHLTCRRGTTHYSTTSVAFPTLTSITRLELEFAERRFSPDTIFGIGALASLQHLELMALLTTPEHLEHLNNLSTLTYLSLNTLMSYEAQTFTFPSPGSLLDLRHLHLRWDVVGSSHSCAWRPQALGDMTNLKSLSVAAITVDCTGVLDADDSPDIDFFAALWSLQQLTSLRLDGVKFLGAPSTYAALVSSDRLLRLVVCKTHIPWDTVFEGAAGADATAAQHAAMQAMVLGNEDNPVSSATLANVIKRCSGTSLQELEVMCEDLDVSGLQEMTALTSLTISGVDDTAAAIIATSLSDLRALHVRSPSSLTDVGLQRFTALKRLTVLGLSTFCLSPSLYSVLRQHTIDRSATSRAGFRRVSRLLCNKVRLEFS